MVLKFASRDATRDVDAVIVAPSPASDVRALARQVAQERGFPEDWLNDAAKGFIEGAAKPEPLLSFPGITVTMPPLPQLAAMKLGAWRDDRDIADAVTIIGAIPGTKDEVWKSIEPFLNRGRELASSYAFESAWELAHGLA